MALGGYADKVAWVDLTTGKTEFKPIPEEYKLKYVGARGVGEAATRAVVISNVSILCSTYMLAELLEPLIHSWIRFDAMP